MSSNYYYLYVYSIDFTGKHNLIAGKLFFTDAKAIDAAKQYCSIPGYHAQIVTNDTVIFDQ